MICPKKEAYRPFTWIEEEINDMEQPERRLQGFEFRNAENMLQESFEPDKIICRDAETQELKFFVTTALQKEESNQSLYIAGVPGVGKTLCVTTVMKNFTDEKSEIRRKYPKFKYVYLNGMKIKRALDIFRQFYIELTSHKERKINSEAAMYCLDNLFRKGIEPEGYRGLSKVMKIVVIDEIDYLVTKDQEVLYNIFDWTQSKTSKLAIIAISNTLNLPETLKPKIMSRIGNTCLVFSTYRSNQIADILKQRVLDTGVFDEKALNLISKKMVTSTSDIRKCLRILRDSLYLHASNSKSLYLVGKVSYSALDQAYEVVYKNPFTQMFKRMPRVHKKILVILAAHFKRSLYSMGIRLLYSQACLEADNIDRESAKQAVLTLADMGVIETRYNKSYGTHFDNKLRNLDEMHITLKLNIDTLLNGINQDPSEDIKVVD